jgi:hypothetical protein
MTAILAIDPGTHESGYCRLVDGKVISSGVMDNADLLKIVRDDNSDVLAIEDIVSYGMVVGESTFITCKFIGRLQEAWNQDDQLMMISRPSVKRHVCGKGKWGDADIRKALIALLGPPGTKAAKGPTYGIKSHAWSACAVAVTAQRSIGPIHE